MSENKTTTLSVATEDEANILSQLPGAEETEIVVADEEDTVLAAADVIDELIKTAFGESATVTPYKIATIINGTFKVLGVEKQIPTQMMYNYDRNGMIVKGKKSVKSYDKDEVTAFVTKYVNKYL